MTWIWRIHRINFRDWSIGVRVDPIPAGGNLMATLAQPAGPFVLGTFSLPDGEPFPGLLARGRVLDLTTALTWAPSGVRAVVERWEEALPVLHAVADEPALDWRPLEGLRVHAPLEPRQIFQS